MFVLRRYIPPTLTEVQWSKDLLVWRWCCGRMTVSYRTHSGVWIIWPTLSSFYFRWKHQCNLRNLYFISLLVYRWRPCECLRDALCTHIAVSTVETRIFVFRGLLWRLHINEFNLKLYNEIVSYLSIKVIAHLSEPKELNETNFRILEVRTVGSPVYQPTSNLITYVFCIL